MDSKLGLSADSIKRCRSLADKIVEPVQQYIHHHTTDSVERATLRLLGADLVDSDGVPVPNLIVDQLKDKLQYGVAIHWTRNHRPFECHRCAGFWVVAPRCIKRDAV